MWLPTRIAGQPNAKLGQYYRVGWMPSPAKDFPKISGYGTEYPPVMIERGLLQNVTADEPIIIDDLMLVERPLELSQRARLAEKQAAKERVDNQMRRLQAAYRMNFDGGGVRRQIRPLSDEGYSQEA